MNIQLIEFNNLFKPDDDVIGCSYMYKANDVFRECLSVCVQLRFENAATSKQSKKLHSNVRA